MYNIASDPQADVKRLGIFWDHMNYRKGSFANAIVDLLSRVGMEIIDENSSNPEIYAQLSQNITWFTQPNDPINGIQTAKGTFYIERIELRGRLAAFVVKHLVEAIPLPAKGH